MVKTMACNVRVKPLAVSGQQQTSFAGGMFLLPARSRLHVGFCSELYIVLEEQLARWPYLHNLSCLCSRNSQRRPK